MEPTFGVAGKMRLSEEMIVKCLKLMMDGMSIRAIERFTGVNRTTLCDLVVVVGENCRELMKHKLIDLKVSNVQVDEVWSFVGCKEKTRERLDKPDDQGDAYAYVAIERNTKLIFGVQLGKREDDMTREFIYHLRSLTPNVRYQLSTDGWTGYRTAVPRAFGGKVDFGVIVKTYKNPERIEQRRYSPPAIVRTERSAVCGYPDPASICTSHVERSNLTLRMTLRRWTRLTNAHSKSWRHHCAAMDLYIAFYNWVRPHSTLGTTPAVAHGLADHAWTMEELLRAAAAA
jgi:IS1 family transposase